jgi:putative NIF3 family GTP cyclohydrolase 1 type 2
VTIDLTAAVLEEAAAFDADMIIAYHPPIFSGIKRFTAAPLVQRAARAGCARVMQLDAVC